MFSLQSLKFKRTSMRILYFLLFHILLLTLSRHKFRCILVKFWMLKSKSRFQDNKLNHCVLSRKKPREAYNLQVAFERS